MTTYETVPPDWHGWSRGGDDRTSLHVGGLPGRKSVCLYVERHREGGCSLDVLAYFRSEDHARQALAVLDELVFGRPMTWGLGGDS